MFILFCTSASSNSFCWSHPPNLYLHYQCIPRFVLVLFQPPSIVTDEVCTACDFNRPGKTCLRKLEWVWRGETFMAKKRFLFLV